MTKCRFPTRQPHPNPPLRRGGADRDIDDIYASSNAPSPGLRGLGWGRCLQKSIPSQPLVCRGTTTRVAPGVTTPTIAIVFEWTHWRLHALVRTTNKNDETQALARLFELFCPAMPAEWRSALFSGYQSLSFDPYQIAFFSRCQHNGVAQKIQPGT